MITLTSSCSVKSSSESFFVSLSIALQSVNSQAIIYGRQLNSTRPADSVAS